MLYKLIQKQRGNSEISTPELQLNGESYSSPEEIRECFFKYFSELALPKDDPLFDKEHKQQVELDYLLIEMITSSNSEHSEKLVITIEDIEKSVKGLNRGKSPDSYGISAEHIQHGGYIIIKYLFDIFKCMIKNRIVPDEIKTGLLTPILKKPKDPKNPNGYRGITVLVTLEKIFEKIWLIKCKPSLDRKQNPMQ